MPYPKESAKINIEVKRFFTELEKIESIFQTKRQQIHKKYLGLIEAAKKARAKKSPCEAIVVTWAWFVGGDVIIKANGTMVAGNNYGTWECNNAAKPKFTLKWAKGGFVDKLTLSPDGRQLRGQNQHGTRVTGKRK